MLCLFQDQYWSIKGTSDWAGVNNWADNPFSALLGNDEQGLMNFFSDQASKDYFKRVLYYIQARWGYSTHLAIWEMGNEVDNIGFKPDNTRLVLTNSQFQVTVNNWLCEMGAYIQSNFDGNYFYPWHPLTIGCAGNIGYSYPSCVNIWSKNSYFNGIENHSYQSPNYNSRFAEALGNFESYHPFIFGEMGGDCEGMDQFSDLEFHNALWATSMMGCIGTGLYWNDWEQRQNVNHRLNYKALRYFFDHVSWDRYFNIERKTTTMTLGSEDEKVQTIYMISADHSIVYGWVNLGCSWWLQDPFLPLNIRNSLVACSGADDDLYDPYSFPFAEANSMPPIQISDLGNWGEQYSIKIYSTHGNGEIIEEINDGCNIAGDLNFYFPMLIPGYYPFYSDFAFQMEKIPIFSARESASQFDSTGFLGYQTNPIETNNSLTISGSNSILYIDTRNGELPISITIVDMLGKIIEIQKVTDYRVNFENVPLGTYCIVIKYQNHEESIRVVKTF